MDVAKSLVRCIVRAFYDTKHVLVIDALMTHNAVRDDDLAHLLGLQTKDLHKLCGKLKEDRLIAVQTRLETKDGQMRPVNRTYYYVDFRATVDAVKYRMYAVTKDVEKAMNKDADTKGLVCPRCSKQFSMLEAIAVNDPMSGMFSCDRCSAELVNDDDSAEATSSQERLGRFSEQTKKIVVLLKQIDEVIVPPTTFDDAFRNAVPVTRDKSHFTANNPQVDERPKAVQGLANGAPALEVSITSNEEKSAAEMAAEQAKKLAQQNQNALPEWYTKSTVTGEITRAGLKEEAERKEREKHLGDFKAMEEEAKVDEDADKGVQADAIAQYYAALKAQEEAEAAAAAAEEEEDDDDDEEDEEFEEVEVSAPPSVGPSSSLLTPKLEIDSGSTTPSGDRPAKRVKIQTPPPGEEDGEDSEEDVDFEDV